MGAVQAMWPTRQWGRSAELLRAEAGEENESMGVLGEQRGVKWRVVA